MCRRLTRVFALSIFVVALCGMAAAAPAARPAAPRSRPVAVDAMSAAEAHDGADSALAAKLWNPPPPAPPVDIDASYDPDQFRLYFLHLANLENAANQAQAAADAADADQLRSFEQGKAGITEAEAAILKEVAFGCNQAIIDHEAALAAAASSSEPPELSPSEDFDQGRAAILAAALQDLQERLGPEAFANVAARVSTLGAQLGLPITPGGPMPPTNAIATPSPDPGPPVEANAGGPSISVLATIVKVGPGLLFAECLTSPFDDLTPKLYPGSAAGCAMTGTDIPAINIPCADAGASAVCSTYFPFGAPGATRWVLGSHGVRMFYDLVCPYPGGTPAGFEDPLNYCSPAGTPLPVITEVGKILARGGSPVCWAGPPPPPDNCALARTVSFSTTFVDVSPRQATLYPGGQKLFTANLQAKWTASGPGHIDDDGTYHAPDTIDAPATATVTGCDLYAQYDCVRATVNLKPLMVTITPAADEVLPDAERQLQVNLTPGMPGVKVDWSLVPHGADDVGSFSFRADQSAGYKAPLNSRLAGPLEVTVKACVTPDPGSSPVCGTAKLTVPKMSMFIVAPKTTLLTYEREHLMVQVLGSSVRREVDWTPIPIDKGTLTVAPTDLQQADYTAPPAATTVDLKVCLRDSKSTCADPFRLQVQEAVVLSSVTGAWYAGDAVSYTITGTGFGTNPVVAFDQLQSLVDSAIDGRIVGRVFIPISLISSTTHVHVSVTLPNGDGAMVTWPNPLTISPGRVLITPGKVDLHGGESATFVPICLDAAGALCTFAGTPSWQTPAQGTIDTVGRYSAPATVSSPSKVTLSACWAVGLCATAEVTLLPPDAPVVSVAVSPGAATVLVGRTQQFTAAVTGTTNTQVTWSLIPATPDAGVILASGLYLAPAALGGVSTVTVVATSVADPGKSGPATVILIGQPTVTGTASPPSSPYGTTLSWTATAHGGTPSSIQLAFFRRKVGSGTGATGWMPDVTRPDWQAGNTFHWTPTADDAGTWETYVWVRDGNTPADANGYGFAAGYNPGPVEITIPLSQLYPAKGWVDGYNTLHIWGWACDPDYPDESNRVDFWTTTGQPLGSTGAFLGSSADIAAQCLGGYAHYFDFYPPGGISSGTHFNAWSIDLPYAATGNDNRRCGGNGSIGDGTEFVIP